MSEPSTRRPDKARSTGKAAAVSPELGHATADGLQASSRSRPSAPPNRSATTTALDVDAIRGGLSSVTAELLSVREEARDVHRLVSSAIGIMDEVASDLDQEYLRTGRRLDDDIADRLRRLASRCGEVVGSGQRITRLLDQCGQSLRASASPKLGPADATRLDTRRVQLREGLLTALGAVDLLVSVAHSLRQSALLASDVENRHGFVPRLVDLSRDLGRARESVRMLGSVIDRVVQGEVLGQDDVSLTSDSQRLRYATARSHLPRRGEGPDTGLCQVPGFI